MTGDALDLDKLRALAEAAKHFISPWEIVPDDEPGYALYYQTGFLADVPDYGYTIAEYITGMDPTTLLALLDAHDTAVRDRDAAVQERDELRAAYDLMTRQFRVMQSEKEHGWREADMWQSRYEDLYDSLGGFS